MLPSHVINCPICIIGFQFMIMANSSLCIYKQLMFSYGQFMYDSRVAIKRVVGNQHLLSFMLMISSDILEVWVVESSIKKISPLETDNMSFVLDNIN